MKKPVMHHPVLDKDVLRYRKNKLSANLALLGLVFGCIYFIVLYAQVKNDNYYYTWAIAFDVIYNLFFLLLTFLLSEEVKNYRNKLFPLQMVLGVLQIARIFWLPLTGFIAGAITVATFLALAIALACSGALIIASGIIGYIRAKSLETFKAQVESGEIDLDAALAEADAMEAQRSNDTNEGVK
jgi:uncharacterized membrane protein (UPF0136 family)